MTVDEMTQLHEQSSDFRHKIKSVEALRSLIGERPRKQSVAMCHGTFDIVHPGHIRHLLYAKERADVLIASLTCDDHINKANHRPIVPQELRAINLSALEFVDYVVIDNEPVPIDNIKRLKPDYFAKGFEYFESGVPPRTQEEIDALESYGGEMIFTPADVVYSSSKLIEEAAPKLGNEKLTILMKSEGTSFDQLRETLDKLSGARVHVLGDTIVDSYTHCSMVGGMVKTPTVSVKYENQTNFVGGAGIVAKHLRRAGAEVVFSTVLGDDELKGFVLDDLQSEGIEVRAYIDKSRPTTQKNTFISNGYHLLRVGKVDNRVVSEKVCRELGDSIASSGMDAYIFSDYRHGIFNPNTIPYLIDCIPDGAFKVADSQVASRWGNILQFQGFDLITPNEREARFALGDQDSVVRPLALNLYRKANCKYLMMTMGEKGVMVYRPIEGKDERAVFSIDSFADKVVDAVGAGDAFLSYATLALLTSGSETAASILGSFAAALATEREGNNPIDPKAVLEKVNSIEKISSFD